MQIDSAFLVALGSVITAVVALFPALSALNQARANARKIDTETRLAARKDELELLRSEVTRLSGRVEELSKDNVRLQSQNLQMNRKVLALEMENAWLRRELRSHGIEIPPLPDEIRHLHGEHGSALADSSVGFAEPSNSA